VAIARSVPLHDVNPPAAKGVLTIGGLLSYFSCELTCLFFTHLRNFELHDDQVRRSLNHTQAQEPAATGSYQSWQQYWGAC
jgi:hypothetical protein